jgi:hypothetical protein
MMSAARLAWLAQLATTLPLVGLIWFVQVVAYPLFALVGPAEFVRYHHAHSNLITFLVGPLMLLELGAACVWVADTDGVASRPVAVAGLALVLLAWAVTGLVSVPQHALLGQGFDARAHALLVTSNWLRTFAWSGRGMMLLALLARRS